MKNLVLLILVTIQTNVLKAQERYSVLITEIMADPAPPVGLPNHEWIELKNTSPLAIDLLNWRIGDASSQSGPLPSLLLQPDSFVIVCATNSLAALSVLGTTIAVPSFPSLDNDGDELFIRSAAGSLIHSIHYSSTWYKNELKKNGGWSLEMIDTNHPCAGMANWKASEHVSGGSPGHANSVTGNITDESGPVLKRSFSINNTTIILAFDEPLDSTTASAVTNYTASDGLLISNITCLPPLFDHVQLQFNSWLRSNIIYTINVNRAVDCSGNVSEAQITRTGIPVAPQPGDVIINEILFDPPANGYDYVELYNNSNHIIDASALYIANRSSSNSISSITRLTATPLYIFPGDYLLLTEDKFSLSLHYHVKDPDALVLLSSMPSFPNDEGTVVLLNASGEIIDEVHYKDDWHFKLLINTEGISLERIDPAGASQDASNWHSAASTAGYGTPGYKNSQSRSPEINDAAVSVSPYVFSPDNDGFDDITSIHYRLDEAGYVVNITIFDAAGHAVKNLVRNGTAGITGYWNWDGLDDKNQKLPVGIYVIYTEIFNLNGKKRRFKNTVVLARKI